MEGVKARPRRRWGTTEEGNALSSASKYTWKRADGSTSAPHWRARWTVDGQRRERRGFTRRGDALRFAEDREAEARHGLALGEQPVSGDMTVAAWSDVWLAGLDVREETQASYDYALSHILPAFGTRQLLSLRQSEIKAWRRAMRRQDGRPLATSTADKVQAILGTMLRAAVDDELLDRSPMPKGRKGQQRVRAVDPAELLTQEQVHAWCVALPEWMSAMPLFAATTGLRQGELLGLRLPAVDFLRRQVHVVEQLRTPKGHGGRPEFGPPKTDASVRSVPLPRMAADVLALHLERFPPVGGEPLFRTQRGLRWRQSNFQAQVLIARRAAGLPDWAHWHGLRSVAISNWIRGGVDLRTVMTIAGHTDPKMTLAVYSRIMPDSIDNARQVSDGMWRSEGVSRQSV